VPLVILLHGCDGLGTLSKERGQHVADVLDPQGVGVLVLASPHVMWIALAAPLTCTGVPAVPTMPTPHSIT
jgi:hypothetical protein